VVDDGWLWSKQQKGNGFMRLIEWAWVEAACLRAAVEGWMLRTPRWAGQSTVEYALVGALVVIAAAAAMTTLGTEITGVFNKITAQLSGAAGAGAGH
jgi:Flp pilus assembly pilin Flp